MAFVVVLSVKLRRREEMFSAPSPFPSRDYNESYNTRLAEYGTSLERRQKDLERTLKTVEESCQQPPRPATLPSRPVLRGVLGSVVPGVLNQLPSNVKVELNGSGLRVEMKQSDANGITERKGAERKEVKEVKVEPIPQNRPAVVPAALPSVANSVSNLVSAALAVPGAALNVASSAIEGVGSVVANSADANSVGRSPAPFLIGARNIVENAVGNVAENVGFALGAVVGNSRNLKEEKQNQTYTEEVKALNALHNQNTPLSLARLSFIADVLYDMKTQGNWIVFAKDYITLAGSFSAPQDIATLRSEQVAQLFSMVDGWLGIKREISEIRLAESANKESKINAMVQREYDTKLPNQTRHLRAIGIFIIMMRLCTQTFQDSGFPANLNEAIRITDKIDTEFHALLVYYRRTRDSASKKDICPFALQYMRSAASISRRERFIHQEEAMKANAKATRRGGGVSVFAPKTTITITHTTPRLRIQWIDSVAVQTQRKGGLLVAAVGKQKRRIRNR